MKEKIPAEKIIKFSWQRYTRKRQGFMNIYESGRLGWESLLFQREHTNMNAKRSIHDQFKQRKNHKQGIYHDAWGWADSEVSNLGRREKKKKKKKKKKTMIDWWSHCYWGYKEHDKKQTPYPSLFSAVLRMASSSSSSPSPPSNLQRRLHKGTNKWIVVIRIT